jgi:imidazolonepropionase-like amidohydrolase
MRKRLATLLLLLLSAPLPSSARQVPTPVVQAPFALVHVTVIDVAGATLRRDVTVVVAEGRIKAVGRSGRVRVPKGARVIDGRGKFLIPGLWDMHAHLGDEEFDRSAHLPLFAANGVTGIRLMSGAPEYHQWRREVEAGNLFGPRMVIASGDIDESKTTEADARRAVISARREGADFFKVRDNLPRASYFALMREAGRLGLPVAGHVPASVTAREVSDAGQRSVEHLTGMDEAKSDGRRAAALLAVFRKNRTWQCPTIIMRHNYAALDDRRLADDPRLKYVKPSWRARWLKMTNEAGNWPAGEGPKRRETVRREKELVGRMQKAGVALLAGTDDANPYSMPGFSLHDELAMLVEAGLTPAEALRAATLNPATFLNRLDSLGTVAPGKLADLVLLDANPLEDIRNTAKVNAVVLRGRLFDRTELDRVLAVIEESTKKK